MFKTIGCAAFVYPPDERSERTQLVSYIDFCYDRLELNQNIGAYYGMFYDFSAFLGKKTLPDPATNLFRA